MTARILPFPDFFRPASPRDEPGVLLILESRSESNQRQTRYGWGSRAPVRCNNRRDGLRVGAADAVQSATSETMDVTAGETALIFPRECPKVQELRRQSKRLREHFRGSVEGHASKAMGSAKAVLSSALNAQLEMVDGTGTRQAGIKPGPRKQFSGGTCSGGENG